MSVVVTEEPGWSQVAALGREVVRIVRPGELEGFDEVAAEVRADPVRVAAVSSLRPPVGFGIDLGLLAPYVLAVASWLWVTATKDAVEVVEEGIALSTRRALGRLFALAKPQEGADTGPDAPAHRDCLRPVSALTCLDPAQEREVYEAVATRAERDGHSPSEAQELAEAVVGALRLRSGCCR
jgi:chorismate mutase